MSKPLFKKLFELIQDPESLYLLYNGLVQNNFYFPPIVISFFTVFRQSTIFNDSYDEVSAEHQQKLEFLQARS